METRRKLDGFGGWFGVGIVVAAIAGCPSPEDGRQRGGGPGADGGNYPPDPIPVPSKLDGTRPAELPQNPLPSTATQRGSRGTS